MANLLTAIGLMSGTSMDGIDVALIKTNGENIVEFGPSETFAYDEKMRALLTGAMTTATSIKNRTDRPGNLDQVEKAIGNAHAKAVDSFLQKNGLRDSDINIIGFHGQTVLHRPTDKLTVQLGDGKALAKATNIDVVYDLRAADVAAGGQGAPLVPVYHQALADKIHTRPLAFVNIGGISNISYIDGKGGLMAFDCGPGNAMLDDWMMKHTGKSFDKDGAFARTGSIDEQVLRQYMTNDYFNQPVPKSLDRYDFTLDDVVGLTAPDGARTLVEITAKSIAKAADWFALPPKEWVICGGGRRNKFLMERIAANVSGIVTPAEAHRLDGDAMEAQAFAYLAVRSLKNLPLTLPKTTGVKEPMTGGLRGEA